MVEQKEKLAERDRWRFGIGALVALAVVLFLVVVLLNAGTILVGIVVTICQMAISLISIAVFVLLLIWILKVIGDLEARIKEDLEALRKTFLRATYKAGADLLALATGLLSYLIQQAVC